MSSLVAHAPSPGSSAVPAASLPASPSSAGALSSAAAAEPYATREWMVIRPHVDFLHEVAARHYPSMFHREARQEKPDAGSASSSPMSSSPSAAGDSRGDAGRRGVSPRTRALSVIVERLIAFCNRENRKTKKEIFRVIRCHNCSQSSTGGTKIGIELALPPHQVLWMRKIHKACKHSSVDKTMRILLEWYIAVLRGNPDMEFVVLGEDTEARRAGPEEAQEGFAMCLSSAHENDLHLLGRKAPGEAERALRAQFEKPTVTNNSFATPTTTSDEPVFKPSPELKVILHNLGKGC